MSAILYYSNFCDYCKELLIKISKTKTRDDIHFICIDNLEKHTDGTTYIILENGQRLQLSSKVEKVPTILLLNHGNRMITGLRNIMHFFSPGEIEIKKQATQMNGEPIAFSLDEMGNNLSDNYSYYDISAKDLLCEHGAGGLRMMHNYYTAQQLDNIETPQEDYYSNKIKNVDLGKLEQQRNADVNMHFKNGPAHQN